MTTRVKYEAVLEYEEENIPADPREEILGLINREPGFGEVTVESAESGGRSSTADKQSESEEVEEELPVNGPVTKTNWVDTGTMLAWVEKDGETWCETYEFQTKERVGDNE